MPRYNKLALCIGILIAQRAGATAMTFSGTLQTNIPTMTASPVGTPLQGVKSSTVNFSSDNSGCQVLYDPNSSVGSGLIPCYFSLDSGIPNGMTYDISKKRIAGYSQVAGSQTLKYSLHYLSGSSKTDTVLKSGDLKFDIQAAVAPVITDIASSFDTSTFVSGYSANIHKRQEKGTIKATVEARNYDQSISIDGFGDCSVAESATSCTITNLNMLDIDGNAVTGSNPLIINANSSNQFFQNVSSGFDFKWDFRPPTAKNVAVSNNENSLATISTLAGNKTVLYSHVGVTITSPHEGESGDWWQPTASTLNLTPNDADQRMSSLTYNGRTVIDLSKNTVTSNTVIKKGIAANLVKTGSGEFLADFDINDVKDGNYTATISATDKYGNTSTSAAQTMQLNRFSPEVALLDDNYQDISANRPMFFFDNLIIGATNGFTGQIKSVKLTVGDIDVPLNSTGTEGVFTTGSIDTSSLVPEQYYPMTLTAEDIYGRKTIKTVQIQYAPVHMVFSPSNSNPIQFTEAITVSVKTAGSYPCSLKLNREDALNAANYSDVGCYVEYELPEDMTYVMDSLSRSYIKGYVNDEVGRIKYKLYAVSSSNVPLKVLDGSFDITAKPAVEPTITLTDKRMYNDTDFLSDVTGGSVGSAIVEASPGVVDISVKVADQEASTTSVKMKAGLKSDTGKYTARVKAPANDTWTILPVTITAKYARTDKFNAVKKANIYYVPTKRLTANILDYDREVADTDNDKVKVQVGVYDNKTKSYVYDKNAYATWKIRLEQIIKGRNEEGKFVTTYKTISDEVVTNDEGYAIVTLDPSKTEGQYVSYRAVADVISPLENFSLSLNSRSKNTVILKGSSVDGSIAGGSVSGKVPFTAKLSFRPDTTQDKQVIGDIQWMLDPGTGVFTEDMNGHNHKNFNFTTPNAGKWLVKAVITNRATGVKSETATTTVIGYELADAKIKQDALVITGQPVPVSIVSDNENVPLGDLAVQWSTDAKNWTDGDLSTTITLKDGEKYIYARVRPAETDDEAGDSSWVTIRHTASLAKLKHITASISGPTQIETNKDIELKGVHEDLFPTVSGLTYKEEWVMPDGSIQSGNIATWRTTEENAEQEVTYRVWLDGYKDQTITEKKTTLKTWGYHFPTIISSSRQDYQIAPATLTVSNKTVFPKFPGVEYTVTYDYDSDVKVLSNTNTKFVGYVTKPGIYNIRMTVSDNRGNSESRDHIIAVDEAQPINITLTPYYKNKFLRTPLDVVVNSGVVLDHDKDSIESFTWSLDGEKQDSQLRRNLFSGLTEGHHVIQFDAVSAFGQRGSKTLEVDVVANQLPVCNPTVYSGSTSWRVSLHCSDPDGRMVAYRWILGDEAKGNTSDTITVTKGLYQTPLVAKAVAVDDSGGETPVQVTLN